MNDARGRQLFINSTIASLSVATDVLMEEPYARLPCLGGSLRVAKMCLEELDAELREHKRVLRVAMEACRANLAYAHAKDEQALHDAFLQCQRILSEPPPTFEWIVGKWYRRREGSVFQCRCINADYYWAGVYQPIQIGNTHCAIDGKWMRGDHGNDIVSGPFDSEEDARNG